MIRQTIEQIENKILNASAIRSQSKKELIDLLNQLKAEVSKLPESERDAAESIAGFTRVSAHEATREERNPRLLKLSVEGLRGSVAGLESSHPRLVQIVNSMCTTMSNLGI